MNTEELNRQLDKYIKDLLDAGLEYYAAIWENFAEKIKAETLKAENIRSEIMHFDDPDGTLVSISRDGDVQYGN